MDLGFKGKTVLVPGTGSQISYGKGIALTLAREGCNIISTDIDFKGAIIKPPPFPTTSMSFLQ